MDGLMWRLRLVFPYPNGYLVVFSAGQTLNDNRNIIGIAKGAVCLSFLLLFCDYTCCYLSLWSLGWNCFIVYRITWNRHKSVTGRKIWNYNSLCYFRTKHSGFGLPKHSRLCYWYFRVIVEAVDSNLHKRQSDKGSKSQED